MLKDLIGIYNLNYGSMFLSLTRSRFKQFYWVNQWGFPLEKSRISPNLYKELRTNIAFNNKTFTKEEIGNLINTIRDNKLKKI